MKRRPVLLLAGLILVGTPASGAGQSVPRNEATLYRCAGGSTRPCLKASVVIRADQMRAASSVPADSLASSWRARFLGDSALGARGQRGRTKVDSVSNRLLLLVDVSGSMKKNLAMGTVKLAVQDFLMTLDSLPPGSVRVAVAPFGSLEVRPRIERAVFTTPDSARRQVDELPDPDRENTGLYSAVELGVGRVIRELANAGGIGVLVVLTDGNNDVRPPSDPGLLEGATGLARAAQTVSKSSVIVNLIGIGDLNREALTTLAGSRKRGYLVGLDLYQVAKPLGEIRDLFWASWDLVIPLSVSREALGRGFAQLTPRLVVGGQSVPVGMSVWSPPLVALPAFEGVAPASLVPAGLGAATVGFGMDRRVPLGLMAAVLLALLWFVVPGRLWPPVAAPVVVASETAARPSAPAPVSAHVGGLRTDLKEVPPRRLTDVTAAKARKSR